MATTESNTFYYKSERKLLFVPVRESRLGTLALRTARLPSGQRVGLAFTSEASLRSALGPGQPWIRLHEDALRDMLIPIGVDHIRADARLVADPEPQRRQQNITPRPPVVAKLWHRTPIELPGQHAQVTSAAGTLNQHRAVNQALARLFTFDQTREFRLSIVVFPANSPDVRLYLR